MGILGRLDIAVSWACDRVRMPDPCRPAPGWRSWLQWARLPHAYPPADEHGHRSLGRGLCPPCRERWRVGRVIRHTACASALTHAVDEYFERLHTPT